MQAFEKIGRQPLLPDRPLPQRSEHQLSLFRPHDSFDPLLPLHIGSFDSSRAVAKLHEQEDARVIGINSGGTNITAITFRVHDGLLVPEKKSTMRSKDGTGYLSFLEKIAQEASVSNIPVGYSFGGGQVDHEGGVIEPGNVTVFAHDLTEKYGTLQNLFPTLQAIPPDDTAAGIILGGIFAGNKYPDTPNVIYIVNGTGLGVSVLTDGQITQTEAGHVRVADELNPGQTQPCGSFGRDAFVCIERVASSGAGIEDLWFRKTGQRLSGEEISQQYTKGNESAAKLYDISATLTAHVIRGVADRYGLLAVPNDTLIIANGGTFAVPGYAQRVTQVLERTMDTHPLLISSDSFSPDACAEGAGVSALLAG